MLRNMTMHTSDKWAIATILALHLILGTAYSTTLPILEGEDEIYHYAYVRYLVTEHRLPRISLEIIQAYHPPLTYVIDALATGWVPDSGRPAANPHWAYDTYRPGADNKNVFIHSPAERFPYGGTALAVHLARLISLAFGAGTIGVVFATARAAYPHRPLLAAGAAAFAAFLPAFISSVTVVSNDALGGLLGSLAIWLTIRCIRRGLIETDVLLLGLLGGVIALNKLTTLFVLAPAWLAIVLWGNAHPLRRFWRTGAAAMCLTAVLPLPWLIRNYLLYHDWTGIGELNRVYGVTRAALPGFAEMLQIGWSGFTHFWIRFGVGQVVAPAPHVGQRSGSSSKICRRSSAQRRRASRSASGTGSATGIGSGGTGAGSPRRRSRWRPETTSPPSRSRPGSRPSP